MASSTHSAHKSKIRGVIGTSRSAGSSSVKLNMDGETHDHGNMLASLLQSGKTMRSKQEREQFQSDLLGLKKIQRGEIKEAKMAEVIKVLQTMKTGIEQAEFTEKNKLTQMLMELLKAVTRNDGITIASEIFIYSDMYTRNVQWVKFTVNNLERVIADFETKISKSNSASLSASANVNKTPAKADGSAGLSAAEEVKEQSVLEQNEEKQANILRDELSVMRALLEHDQFEDMIASQSVIDNIYGYQCMGYLREVTAVTNAKALSSLLSVTKSTSMATFINECKVNPISQGHTLSLIHI